MTTNQPSQPTSPQQLERDVHEQRAKLFNNPPPSAMTIDAARNTTTDLQARLAALAGTASEVDTALMQEDLRLAQQRLAALLAERDAHSQAQARLTRDETRLDELQQQQRMERIAEADRRLAAAHERFKHNARELCRAYRDACRIAQANGRIPGASVKLPGDFTIDSFVPHGWQGRTSEHIRDDSLVWLRDEQEQAA